MVGGTCSCSRTGICSQRHNESLTTTCDSSFRGSNAAFWPSQAQSMHMMNIYACKRHIHTYTHKQFLKIILKFRKINQSINQSRVGFVNISNSSWYTSPSDSSRKSGAFLKFHTKASQRRQRLAGLWRMSRSSLRIETQYGGQDGKL